jgi:hypothetical protein
VILVVSATRTTEVSFSSLRELEELVAIHEELLDKFSADELGCVTDEDGTESEELDSSATIALLSPFSEAALLPSSPQAAKSMHAKMANPTKNFDS